MGVAPFELVHRRHTWQLLQALQEDWVRSPLVTQQELGAYIQCLKERLMWARELANQCLCKAQGKQKDHYDRIAKDQTFQLGDRVMVHSTLFPRNSAKE